MLIDKIHNSFLETFKAFERGNVYHLVSEHLRGEKIDDSSRFFFYFRRPSVASKDNTYSITGNNIQNKKSNWRIVVKIPLTVNCEKSELSIVTFISSIYGASVLNSTSDATKVYRQETGNREAIIDEFNLVCVDFTTLDQSLINCNCIEDICETEQCEPCK